MLDARQLTAQLEDARKKVDVDSYNIIVRELVGMTERGELHRAPEYQRKFRWDAETESRLVESVLLGLPIPNIFVATNEDGSWEVVDGLQRISTLLHFTTDDGSVLKELGKESPLKLDGLRTLTSFNGLNFGDLPASTRMNFMKRGIGVTALSDKSDPDTRYATFERLNRGAVALSPQEIRACIYEGPLNSLIRELADNLTFKSVLKLQKKDEANATAEELVLKFFAYLNNRDNFSGAVDDFLSNYMKENQHSFDVNAGRAEFTKAVDALAEINPGKFLRANTNVTPKNELEAVLVAIADIHRTGGQIAKPLERWLDDPQLVSASTGATNTRRKLRERIKRATELLQA
ncbi:DUF262 domain-containing protein [Kocuria sp. U4B]